MLILPVGSSEYKFPQIAFTSTYLFQRLLWGHTFHVNYLSMRLSAWKFFSKNKKKNVIDLLAANLIACWIYFKQTTRASAKWMYGIKRALRLLLNSLTDLQGHTVDFRNFFCPAKIYMRDVQNCQKAGVFLSCYMMFALPIGKSLPELIFDCVGV